MLMIRGNGRLTVVTSAALVLSACSALAPGATQPQDTSNGAVVATSDAPSGDEAAAAACSTVLEDPLRVQLVVKSGEPTIAAAYRITGKELATYLDRFTAREGDSPSVWGDQPDKLVDMCIIDGDLYTQTPGPPGDGSAVRVLVIVSDDGPFLWTIARKDKSLLPTTDPATIK
jgi:hypothetical protein